MCLSITASAPTLAGGLSSLVKGSFLLHLGQAEQTSGHIEGDLNTLGFTGINIQEDKQATSWSVGYRHPFNSHWSLDSEYLDQGATHPNVQATLPLGKTNAQAAQDIAKALPKRGRGLSFTGVRHFSVSERIKVQAGVGGFLWQSQRKASVAGNSHTNKEGGLSPLLHLGIAYAITPKITADLKWQEAFMPDDNVSNMSIGMALAF
ncbi:MAG: outer membrane beta-barrel protein [Thiotrichaceae bacterium]|nr:outer membrane beta-barrel protein [Thiotrichaceae bacterium]